MISINQPTRVWIDSIGVVGTGGWPPLAGMEGTIGVKTAGRTGGCHGMVAHKSCAPRDYGSL